MSRPGTLTVLLVLGGFASGAAAQEPNAASSANAGLDEVVRALVGDEWGVVPSSIVLEWGAARDRVVEPLSHVELVGTGARGSFVVRVGPPESVSAIRVRAGMAVQHSIAARRLPKGTVLVDADIGYVPGVAWGPPDAVDDVVEPGWVAQRTLARGDRLKTPSVRRALSVTSGSPVEIVWRRGSVALALPGVAAGNGTIGELVLVRSASGQRMRGIIVAPGVVDVTRGASSNTGGR